MLFNIQKLCLSKLTLRNMNLCVCHTQIPDSSKSKIPSIPIPAIFLLLSSLVYTIAVVVVESTPGSCEEYFQLSLSL